MEILIKIYPKKELQARVTFLEQGISPKQIFCKGYGESVQLKCIPKKAAPRRTSSSGRSEFVIKSLKKKSDTLI
jgi:hypothetical protein